MNNMPSSTTRQDAPVDTSPSPAYGQTAAPLPSERLLQGRKSLDISHNGMVYKLQTTKLGKLILTK
jgi:hemin uptake protein HemP